MGAGAGGSSGDGVALRVASQSKGVNLMSFRNLRCLPAVAACCAVSLVPASAAFGAEAASEYAPNGAARDFGSGDGRLDQLVEL
jgi:hypothetical protein